MIKKTKNGFPDPFLGACLGFPQTSAHQALSSAGVQLSLSPERTSWFGRACSLCAEPRAMKAKIRKADQQELREQQEFTQIHPSTSNQGLRSKYQSLLIDGCRYIDTIIDILGLFSGAVQHSVQCLSHRVTPRTDKEPY